MFSASLAAFAALAALTLQGCSRSTAPANHLTTGTFVKIPSYAGALTISGTVTVEEDCFQDCPTQQKVSATLIGVDTACTGTQGGAGSRCGFHIHEGTSCDTVIGARFRIQDNESANAWKHSTYTDAANGEASATVTVNTGYTIPQLEGHVMVVHDSAGKQAACAVMERSTAPEYVAAASARTGTDQEAPGVSPLLFVGAMLVMAVLGGGAWFCWSSRRGYAAQQDESVEVQSAAPKQDDSMEGENVA